MNEQKQVPELRFPEFSGEWNIIYLGKVGFFKNGINKDKKEFGFGVPFVNLMDVFAKSSISDEDLSLVNVNQNEIKSYNLKKGDVLFIRSSVKKSGVGETSIVANDMPNTVYSGFLIRYRSDKGIYDYLFKKYCFWTSSFRNLVISYSTTSANTNINQESLNQLFHFIPTIPEQQKIAAFLSAVDKKIEQLQQKKSLLEQYKKGMMQKLFGQEIRFKDENGNTYPDWEVKKLGEVYSFYSTNSYSRDKLNYESGEVLNIHYGDIHTQFKQLFDIEKETVPFINQDVKTDNIKPECFCQKGDLVIADASEDYNDIGKAIEIVNLNNKQVVAGLHTFLARPTKNKIALGFSGQMMKSWAVRKQIMKIAQGTKVLGLATSRMKNIILNIPTVSEQTKIANFLSAIDAKIELVNTQIEKSQQFKKGLLQKMFV